MVLTQVAWKILEREFEELLYRIADAKRIEERRKRGLSEFEENI
jgi:hypothetical protein